MPVSLQTKRVYEESNLTDGRRILIMRYWPRGIARHRVDDWEPVLAPSRSLLAAYRNGELSWQEYAIMFQRQLGSDPQTLSLMDSICTLACQAPITLLCACEDPSFCHRTLVKRMALGRFYDMPNL